MRNLSIKTVELGSFGEGIKLSNGTIELSIPKGFGPRILRFAFVGDENILYEDINENITNSSKELEVFGDNSKWRLYGGHRLWAAPESMPRTYYPDNDMVEFEDINMGIRVKQSKQKFTDIKLEIDIIFSGDNEVTLTHRITNCGAWPITLSPWAITVMDVGGTEIIPFYGDDTGLLPNRTLSLWPYCGMNDKRLSLGEKYIKLRQDTVIHNPFKLGVYSTAGWAGYIKNNTMFLKSFNIDRNGIYPDYGVCYETYTNNLILEMESLGPLTKLKGGECVTHTEVWRLIKLDGEINLGDDNQIEAIVNKYI